MAEARWPAQQTGTRALAERVVELEALLREHEQTLRALCEREEEFRLLLSEADHCFWMTDPELTHCYFISPAYERIWARSRESFAANPRGFFDTVLPEDLPQLKDAWMRRMQRLPVAPQAIEFRIHRPDGTIRWIRGRGFLIQREGQGRDRYLGFSQDITERKEGEATLQRAYDELEARVAQRTEQLSRANARLHQEIQERAAAEQSLRRSEELYRLLAEHATDMISKHTLSGTFTYVSPACQPLLGYEPHELIGRDPYQFFHPEDLEAVRTSHHTILREPDSYTVTYRFRRKDDTYTWLESVSQTIRNLHTGEELEIIVVSRDVNQRKQAEEERRLLSEELMHVSRLTSLGEMASGLAHELNQPLAAVSNYVGAARRMLEEMSAPPPAVLRAMVDAAGEAQRAGQIIRHIRSLARRGRTRFSTANVNELVQEVAALAAADIRASGTSLSLVLLPGLPATLVDRIQIQQVLLNLVRNGLEAMQAEPVQGRALTIQTETRDHGTFIEAAVTDTGCGISEEVRGRLFEPFFTTKSEGMGMGLPISRTIVDAHGGRLWADPVEPRGACFRFTLPVRS